MTFELWVTLLRQEAFVYAVSPILYAYEGVKRIILKVYSYFKQRRITTDVESIF